MNWKAFIEHLKSLGYEGPGDDFKNVTRWLRVNGHDAEVVEGADGEQIELTKLYDDRPGKPLDVSAAAAKARQDDEVDRRVRTILEEERAIFGKGRGDRNDVTNPHKHDISVGKDRLSDDPKGGFKHFGELCRDVIKAGKKEGDAVTSDRLAMWQKAALSTYGSEAVGTDGGFTVPPEFRDQVMIKVEGEESILARTDQIPLSSNSISIPCDETTPWQTTGGIQAYWEGEAGTYAQSKPAFKMKDLKLRKVTALVPVTEELMDDSNALASYVPRKAGEKLDFKVGEAIFRGNGTTAPLGFLTNTSGDYIAVAKETNQAADSLAGINILKMWSRMYAPRRRNSVWFIQQDVEPVLMRLSLAGITDTGGAATGWGAHVYIPPGGLSGSPYGTLLGRPVIPTQHCETLGDLHDIILADMSQYVTATRGGVDQQTSMHLWFDQDAIALKFRMRIDGQPWSDSTIASRDGSNTLASFVTLAERGA